MSELRTENRSERDLGCLVEYWSSIVPVSRRPWVRIPLEPQNFFWALFVTAVTSQLRRSLSLVFSCVNGLMGRTVHVYLFIWSSLERLVGDWRFDYLSGSHLQNQVKSRRHDGIYASEGKTDTDTDTDTDADAQIQSSDDTSSLDSEDDYRSGTRNVSHQQQSFWRLPSPQRSR